MGNKTIRLSKHKMNLLRERVDLGRLFKFNQLKYKRRKVIVRIKDFYRLEKFFNETLYFKRINPIHLFSFLRQYFLKRYILITIKNQTNMNGMQT